MRIVWLALVLLAARGAAAAEMSGAQLLRKSAAAYTALQSYAGRTTVRSEVVVGRTKLAQTATALIRYRRPGKIHIVGKDATGRPYRIISDGHAAWSAPTSRTNPAWQKMSNVEMAVAGLTGVAAGAPTTIPAALLNLRWGNPFVRIDGSRIRRRARIGGHDCYEVVNANIGRTQTYWIDRHSFLMRQMKEEQNAQQLSALSRGAAIASRVVLYTFAIDRINGPVRAKLFLPPKP